MDQTSERIQVEIYGSTYSLFGGPDPAAVRSLAAEVDSRMKEIAGAARGADPLKVAVLAALRLADEARELEQTAARRERDLSETLGAMAARLKAALAPPPVESRGSALDGNLPLG